MSKIQAELSGVGPLGFEFRVRAVGIQHLSGIFRIQSHTSRVKLLMAQVQKPSSLKTSPPGRLMNEVDMWGHGFTKPETLQALA